MACCVLSWSRGLFGALRRWERLSTRSCCRLGGRAVSSCRSLCPLPLRFGLPLCLNSVEHLVQSTGQLLRLIEIRWTDDLCWSHANSLEDLIDRLDELCSHVGWIT